MEELRTPRNAISVYLPAHPGEVNLNVSEIIYHVETRSTRFYVAVWKELMKEEEEQKKKEGRRRVGVSSSDSSLEYWCIYTLHNELQEGSKII
jgi:hypothetical protein